MAYQFGLPCMAHPPQQQEGRIIIKCFIMRAYDRLRRLLLRLRRRLRPFAMESIMRTQEEHVLLLATVRSLRAYEHHS